MHLDTLVVDATSYASPCSAQVCVPNKVEQLRAIPRRAAESGIVYYTKPGKKDVVRTFQVRPRVVYKLCQWLKANAKAYAELDIVDSKDFGGNGESLLDGSNLLPERPPATWSASEQTLEFAILDPGAEGDDVLEDTGPAPSQNAIAEDEDFDTSSGFCAVLPAANVQASIDSALAQAAAATPGGERTPAGAHSGSGGAPVFEADGAATDEDGCGSEPVFHVSGEPQAVSEFDPTYFVMAFPEIFLTGEADLYADRKVKITLPQWLEHVLWSGDQCAARHKVFPFVAFSFQQRHRAMDQGSYFVHVCVDPRDDSAASLEDLTERIAHGDNSLAKSVFFWAANIAGSDAHLGQLKREIDALITDQLISDEPNPPSLFLSGSCAEFYWKPLLGYLANHVLAIEGPSARVWDKEKKEEIVDETINRRWADDPTAAEFQTHRRNKLNEYAHIVTSFFEQRTTSFVKDVLAPMLEIEHFYMIFEFAEGRGQIHFHLLAWLKKHSRHNLHSWMHREVPREFAGREETQPDGTSAFVGDTDAAIRAWTHESLLGAGDPPSEEIRAEIAACASIDERRALWKRNIWRMLVHGDNDARLRAYRHAVEEKGDMLDRTTHALPPSLRRDALVLPASLEYVTERELHECDEKHAKSSESQKAKHRTALLERPKMAWKALLLESWMRARNFRTDHPVDDRSQWPVPEGSAASLGQAPISILRAELLQCEEADGTEDGEEDSSQLAFAHMANTHNFCKLHRCRRSYCLCQLRKRSDEYRECAKGGFGPEAPLVGHQIEGAMRPEGGGDTIRARGKGVRYDAKGGYYVVQVGANDVVVGGHDGRLYICETCDALPVGTAQCEELNCQGCDRAPPMGKPHRAEPALVEQRGILSIELPRTHPRYVQGIRVVTEWSMSNDDQSVIICRNAPSECTADELAEVAHYVPGYMTKGGKGSSEYAAIFKTIVNGSDKDTSIKTLVRRLLIRIVGKDFPRQQVLYLLTGDGRNHGLLRRTSATFKKLSLTGSRLLKPGAAAADGPLEKSLLDRYKVRPHTGKYPSMTLWQYTRKDGHVPLVSGGHLWTDPENASYCRSMFKLHWAWRKESELPSEPVDAFEEWQTGASRWGPLPAHIKLELGKLKARQAKSTYLPTADDDRYEYAEENPEWLDLIGNSEFTQTELADLKFDDFTQRTGFNHWDAHGFVLERPGVSGTIDAPVEQWALTHENVANWWNEQVELETQRREASSDVTLFEDNPWRANRMQSAFLALLLYSMYCRLEGAADPLNLCAKYGPHCVRTTPVTLDRLSVCGTGEGALALCDINEPTPLPSLTTSFCGTIYFSHCSRCGRPWSNEECTFDAIRAEVLREISNKAIHGTSQWRITRRPDDSQVLCFSVIVPSIGFRVCVDANGNLMDPPKEPARNWSQPGAVPEPGRYVPHINFVDCVAKEQLPDWGKTLRHDLRHPGMPICYSVVSDAHTLHLLGRTFNSRHFAISNGGPHRCPLDGTNRAYLTENRVRDPPGLIDALGYNAKMEIICGPPKASRGAVGTPEALAEPADLLYVMQPMWPSGSEHVQDAFEDNLGGRTDIFYEPPMNPFGDMDRKAHNRAMAARGPFPRGVELRPAVDRTEELLQRIEACAATHGLAVPYLQPDFVPLPASVEPQLAAASSSANTAPPQAADSSNEALEGLGPLHAVPTEAAQEEVAEDEYSDDECCEEYDCA